MEGRLKVGLGCWMVARLHRLLPIATFLYQWTSDPTIKTLFPHKIVKLVVHEVSNATQATEPNLRQLLASVTDGLTTEDLVRQNCLSHDRNKRKNLLDLYGSDGIDPDYDYKMARSSG